MDQTYSPDSNLSVLFDCGWIPYIRGQDQIQSSIAKLYVPIETQNMLRFIIFRTLIVEVNKDLVREQCGLNG